MMKVENSPCYHSSLTTQAFKARTRIVQNTVAQSKWIFSFAILCNLFFIPSGMMVMYYGIRYSSAACNICPFYTSLHSTDPRQPTFGTDSPCTMMSSCLHNMLWTGTVAETQSLTDGIFGVAHGSTSRLLAAPILRFVYYVGFLAFFVGGFVKGSPIYTKGV